MLAESRAFMGLLESAQDLPADANGRFLRLQLAHGEDLLCVVVAILRAEPVAAPRDQADAAPLTVAHLEDLFQQAQGRRVAFAANGPAVLVLDLGPALLELPYGAQNPFEHVDRFKTGDDNRHAIALDERFVFLIAHHRADVPRPQEALHAIAG